MSGMKSVMNRRQMDRSQSRDFMTRVYHGMRIQETGSKTAVIIVACTSAVRVHAGAMVLHTLMACKLWVSITFSRQ
jgi:hypothetical protein